MIGETILHYRVLEKLGAGGMGEIYKAQDTRLNRIVAVKVLAARLSAEPERRKRFLQEARAASALNHPNIITLFDIVSDGDMQCIVMEYVSGRTLREMIPSGGLPAPQAVQYAMQVAGALSSAHAAGIIHRDLKPSNVMITTSGLVKILDFGLAKWIDPTLAGQSGEQSTIDQAVTTEGSIVGTVSYMSPEQALGKRVDTRSDIFSFGSMMYEMVTGRRAFEGSSGISTLSSILRDDVRPIVEIAPNIPAVLEQLILRCLPKDPDARWQSMKEIEGALTALHRQLDPSGRYTVPITVIMPGPAPTVTSEPASASSQSNAPAVPPPLPLPSAPVAAASGAAPPSATSVAAPPKPADTKKPASQKAAASKARNEQANKTLAWGLTGVVLIAASAVGAWWMWKGQQQAPSSPVAEVAAPPASSAPAPAAPAVVEPAPVLPAPEATPAPTNPPPARSTTPAAPKKTPAKSTTPKNGPAPKAAAPAEPAPAPPQPAAEPAPEPAPQPRAAAPQVVAVAVTDALPFRMVLAEDVPADVEQGKSIRFTVADGLRVGDRMVIAKGATVTGMVAREAARKKFLAFGGSKSSYELQRVDAVDGKKLTVRATAGRPGDGPAMRPFDTGKGSKPKGLAATQGTEYIAYIDGDQSVSVPK